MPRPKSPRFRRAAAALSTDELPLILITVEHPLLAEPIRLVNDTQDVVSNGHNYRACRFGFTWPDDEQRQSPRAQLVIGNNHSDVGAFFERSHGGRGSVVTAAQIMRSAPDFREDELVLDLSGVEVSTTEAAGRLGYDDILNKASVPITYRPDTAPGLF